MTLRANLEAGDPARQMTQTKASNYRWTQLYCSPDLGIRAWAGFCLPLPSAVEHHCRYFSHREQENTISTCRENHSMENFPFLLFPIWEEVWKIPVYKHSLGKAPTPAITWILFELQGNYSTWTWEFRWLWHGISGWQFQAFCSHFAHFGSFTPGNASVFYNEKFSTRTLYVSLCSWMTTSIHDFESGNWFIPISFKEIFSPLF